MAAPLFWTRLVHTAIWAVLASAIASLPLLAATQRFGAALLVTGLVSLEGVALGLGGGRCPLTAVARRYTAETGPSFDIFLPELVARWNKEIFGTLFVAGELLVAGALLLSGDRPALFRQLAALAAGGAATALAFLVRRR